MEFWSLTGFTTCVVVAVGLVTRASASLSKEWLAVGILVPVYVAFFSHRRFTTLGKVDLRIWLQCAFALACIGITMVVSVAGHRGYVALIAFAETSVLLPFVVESRRDVVPIVTMFVAALVTWSLSASLPYTELPNLLLDAGTTDALFLPVFSVALFATCVEAAGSRRFFAKIGRSAFQLRALQYALATFCFLEFAFRTDGLLADWVPYHRDFFVEPAAFVRAGHWLLWDVPSQYGFFSEVALALTPGKTVWQSLFVLTGVILTAEALLLFFLLRYRRTGLLNFFFSLTLSIAAILGPLAYRGAFGARLYPQLGLRFLWPLFALFVVFLLTNCENSGRRRWLLLLGHGVWIAGVLWSFECAVWTSLIWLAYLATDSFVQWREESDHSGWLEQTILRFGPIVLLPGAAALLIQIYYSMSLGHGPDWIGYLEFSAVYAAAVPADLVTDKLGSGWMVVLLLGAVGTTIVLAMRAGQYRLLPLFIACWTATWGASVYYAGEVFNNHVSAITPFFTFVFAMIVNVADRELLSGTAWNLVRLSFVPMIVILLSTTFGEPAHLAEMRMPLFTGWSFDDTALPSPIPGELVDLMDRAGVRPSDKVIVPTALSWVKLDLGLILPLVRNSDGSSRQLVAFLPVSPIGPASMMATLSSERRAVYLYRFLQRERQGGWYATFHERPDCEVLSRSLQNGEVFRSRNFGITFCKVRLNWRAASTMPVRSLSNERSQRG